MSARKISESRIEELPDELANSWEKMVAEADADLHDVRVSFRWLKPQVDVIRRAAAQYGIPYQTYIKQAAFRAALADLQAVKMAGEVGRSRR
jgi:predicted DNA binding CopG/RHH family protein